MGGLIRIGVKYCGGCNPDYDRVASVLDLAEELKDVVEFVSVSNDTVDFFLVVQGCRTACADLGPLKGKPFVIVNTLQHLKSLAPKIRAGTVVFSESSSDGAKPGFR
jgi:hypothetical protein